MELVWLKRRPLEFRGGLGPRSAAASAIAGLAHEVRTLVRRTRPSVLVAWNMRALLACVPALARIGERPRLVFAHNDFLPGPWIGRTIRAAARRADLIVCLSEAIQRDLDMAGDVRVVPAGVDLVRFSPAGEPARDAPVLMLSAIEPWKRPELALDVAARLPGLRLKVAGEPIGAAGAALLASLRRRAAAPDLSGRVELRGRIDDPVSALRVEALACGVPVVAPAAAGPLEIVGGGGRLYTPGSAADAAVALSEALEPARRGILSAAARRRAEEHFDVAQTRERWSELLGRI
jgi:glycosyltransferase involved in cell wall biosynthesis